MTMAPGVSESPAGGLGPAGPSRSASTAKVDDPNVALIKEPMVGTFYAAPSPDAPPFIKVGDHIGPQSIAW